MAVMTMLNKAHMRVLPLGTMPTLHQERRLQVCKNLKEKICLCLKSLTFTGAFQFRNNWDETQSPFFPRSN